MSFASEISERLDEMTSQRNALMEALKLAEPLVESLVDVSGYKTHKERAALVAIRSAIAKCEAQS